MKCQYCNCPITDINDLTEIVGINGYVVWRMHNECAEKFLMEQRVQQK